MCARSRASPSKAALAVTGGQKTEMPSPLHAHELGQTWILWRGQEGELEARMLLHQAKPDGFDGGLRAVAGAELLQDRVGVAFDGAGA